MATSEANVAVKDDQAAPSEAEVQEFVQKAFGDIGAMLTASLVVIGDKLGLYKAMAATGPLTPAELAERTGTSERYVREWCAAQAAAGYVTYDAATGRYTLPAAHAVALTDEDSPACMLGGFQGMSAATRAEPKIIEAFRSGARRRLARARSQSLPGHRALLPPGLQRAPGERLDSGARRRAGEARGGARVADVGCGHGASTIIMAKAFPRSTFVGFDYHAASIESARQRAREAGVADRVRFEVAAAKDYPGTDYDLVAFFDCLHDMGDPVGAARHVRESLAPDGTWLLVEPFANDKRRGEPEPDRPRLLLGLDAGLHARLALAGGRPGARRAGRRGTSARRAQAGRLHPHPPRHRDAVQPGPRGAPLIVVHRARRGGVTPAATPQSVLREDPAGGRSGRSAAREDRSGGTVLRGDPSVRRHGGPATSRSLCALRRSAAPPARVITVQCRTRQGVSGPGGTARRSTAIGAS